MTVTLVGKWRNPDGSVASGSVLFEPSNTLVDAVNDEFVVPVPPVRSVLDSTGAISVAVTPTDTLTPSGWYYKVTENIGDAVRTYMIQIASTPTTQNLNDIVPLETPLAVEIYVPKVDTPEGTLTSPRYKLTVDHDPDTAESNLFEIHAKDRNGSDVLTFWFNERGEVRVEQPWSLHVFDNCYVATLNYHNDTAGSPGYAFRTRVRNSDGSLTYRGALDGWGRPATSLETWTAVTAVDPNATGRYVMATGDAEGGSNNIDALGVRLVSDDRVEMRGGVVVSGTTVNGDIMFNLPSGFAPKTKVRTISCATSAGATSIAQVNPAGQVLLRRTATLGTWFFDCIVFTR